MAPRLGFIGGKFRGAGDARVYVVGDVLNVTVRFAADSREDSGRIWWINNRGADGSPRYLKELIPDENSREMVRDPDRDVWTAEIKPDPMTTRIDLFSNHRKTIAHRDVNYSTYISSPYTRVEIKKAK